jgi:hypothetical protein
VAQPKSVSSVCLLIDVLEVMKVRRVSDRVKVAAQTIYQA